MWDAEKDWHERSFHASGAINGSQKLNFLSTNRKSNFLSLFLSHQWRIFKGSFMLLTHTSILFCLLEYNLSIFVVSCSNLNDVRQCRRYVPQKLSHHLSKKDREKILYQNFILTNYALCKLATCARQSFLSKTFANTPNKQKQ